MPANTDLRWLKPAELKGAARRFSEFCKTDIKQQASADEQFDVETYNKSVKLIVDKLKASRETIKKVSE
ncbi:hypothetical protein [Leucothrix arctica]|uniref:Uncharacterized protein n=1 Tax=Leucothrix arctica TaxID=1481894 RepID=A0A317CE11_9GAMM|nr:hypothetical protein [Leucothrix arctica]PWQ96351.1 hypothetical protein DKT75_10225 [Leucothrix arctica]